MLATKLTILVVVKQTLTLRTAKMPIKSKIPVQTTKQWQKTKNCLLTLCAVRHVAKRVISQGKVHLEPMQQCLDIEDQWNRTRINKTGHKAKQTELSRLRPRLSTRNALSPMRNHTRKTVDSQNNKTSNNSINYLAVGLKDTCRPSQVGFNY